MTKPLTALPEIKYENVCSNRLEINSDLIEMIKQTYERATSRVKT